MLYEMVAGELPFRASSHQQLELLITSGAPPAALPESCPAVLQAIIYKALSGNVSDRYPDARAFGDDLQKFCMAPDSPTVQSTFRPVDNPTRKVSFPAAAPVLQQPASQTGSSRFNSTPASDVGKPPRRHTHFPTPPPQLAPPSCAGPSISACVRFSES